MSNPVTTETLEPLLPTTDKSLCELLQPGIINVMTEITKGYDWEFKVNGSFSEELVAQIRALECVEGGVVLPCPVVALAGVAVPRDGSLRLTFNGTRMTAGYAYSIQQSTVEGEFPDPAFVTGTTTGSVITENVSGLTNGTEYFFRLIVQKPTCAEYAVDISGTPQECQNLMLSLTAVNDAPGHAIITVTGTLEPQFTYTLYASNLPNQIGSPVESGLVSDKQAQINGALAFRYAHTPAPTGIPGGGQTWTYTVQIKEKPACHQYELSQSVFVHDLPLDAPVLSFSDLAFRWPTVNGAVAYDVYVRAAGSCRSDANFTLRAHLVGTPPPISYSFTQARFPCTENADSVYCISKWEVYVIAYGSSGQSSQSNTVLTPTFIKFTGQCV